MPACGQGSEVSADTLTNPLASPTAPCRRWEALLWGLSEPKGEDPETQRGGAPDVTSLASLQ